MKSFRSTNETVMGLLFGNRIVTANRNGRAKRRDRFRESRTLAVYRPRPTTISPLGTLSFLRKIA